MLSFFGVVFATLGVIALMAGVLFAIRFLTNKVSFNPAGGIKVIDRVGLSKDNGLCVVSVKGKLYLIGISQHSTEILQTLDCNEDEYFIKRENDAVFPSFAQFLENVKNRKEKSRDEYSPHGGNTRTDDKQQP
jgi:flagellar biogenesis protein FliO